MKAWLLQSMRFLTNYDWLMQFQYMKRRVQYEIR